MRLTNKELEWLEDNHFPLEERQLIADGLKIFGPLLCKKAYLLDEGANTTGWTFVPEEYTRGKEYFATLYGSMLIDAGHYLVKLKKEVFHESN
jgi:hypothetical protein